MNAAQRRAGLHLPWRRLGMVLGALGRLLVFFGVVLALPALVGLWYHETRAALIYLEAGAVTVVAGWVLLRWMPWGRLGTREAVLVCTGAWVICSLVAAVPVWLTSHLAYADAVFECVSGLTTTGLSILNSVGEQPRTLVFWRSLSQLLGGLGILSFYLLVSFPGGAAHRLFHTENTKAGYPRPVPSLRRTVIITWTIYGALVAANLLALLALGAGFFDSLNLAFCTPSTGGFAPHDLGVGHFRAAGHPQALLIELTLMAFMALGGLNFLLHYRACTGRVFTLFSGQEARGYWLLMLLVTAFILVESLGQVDTWQMLSRGGIPAGAGSEVGLEALRIAGFQTVSLASGAGHLTVPLSHPFFGPAARLAFLLLLLVGGCVGSTSGGVRVLRLLLLGRSLGQEVRKLAYPEGAALPVVMDGAVIPTSALQPVAAMVFAWMAMALLGGAYLAGHTTAGPVECLTLSLSAVSNTGPSLAPGQLLPQLPLSCRLLLMVWMIAGRLEVLPVLALFVRRTWQQ